MIRSEKKDLSRLDFGAREILYGEESSIGLNLDLDARIGFELSQNEGGMLGISENTAPKNTSENRPIFGI
jgi:hypothetical protein